MKTLDEYLARIENPSHRERMEEIFNWIRDKYPNLQPTIKWNQPMFTDHGTFIIGFSISKKHAAVAPEQAAIAHAKGDIEKAGYDCTENIIRLPWDRPVPYALLEKLIDFNLRDKADCTTFWRK
ncbi:MAG: hypothetical protein CW342_06050 [Thermoactinomycetaceae bacterium]|jgi:uncharacterized protein YdhG (YjbR/CyaY superfamily)|nr:hypothetical protein [Bacillota bacterium]MBO2532445.1 hypothetical protein [Thermoactinomycetaceae bacterium]